MWQACMNQIRNLYLCLSYSYGFSKSFQKPTHILISLSTFHSPLVVHIGILEMQVTQKKTDDGYKIQKYKILFLCVP